MARKHAASPWWRESTPQAFVGFQGWLPGTMLKPRRAGTGATPPVALCDNEGISMTSSLGPARERADDESQGKAGAARGRVERVARGRSRGRVAEVGRTNDRSSECCDQRLRAEMPTKTVRPRRPQPYESGNRRSPCFKRPRMRATEARSWGLRAGCRLPWPNLRSGDRCENCAEVGFATLPATPAPRSAVTIG